MATLYRCRTPTDRLCPCGRVARELRRQGIPFERDARALAAARPRRGGGAQRPAHRVPLLVLDGEAICDSHRIVEHLRWRAGRCSTVLTEMLRQPRPLLPCSHWRPLPRRTPQVPRRWPFGDVRAGMSCTVASVIHGTDVTTFDAHVDDVIAAGLGPGDGAHPRHGLRAGGRRARASVPGSPARRSPARGRTARRGSSARSPRRSAPTAARPCSRRRSRRSSASRSTRRAPPPRGARAAALLRRARPISEPLSYSGLSPGGRPGLPARRRARRPHARARAAAAGAGAGAAGDRPRLGDRRDARDGRRRRRRDRHRRVRRRHDRLGLRASVRRGRPALDVPDRGLRLRRRQQPARHRRTRRPTSSRRPTATIGTLTQDGVSGVVGRLGAPPPSFPLQVSVRDLDTRRLTGLRAQVADERAIGLPTGSSALSAVAPAGDRPGALRGARRLAGAAERRHVPADRGPAAAQEAARVLQHLRRRRRQRRRAGRRPARRRRGRRDADPRRLRRRPADDHRRAGRPARRARPAHRDAHAPAAARARAPRQHDQRARHAAPPGRRDARAHDARAGSRATRRAARATCSSRAPRPTSRRASPAATRATIDLSSLFEPGSGDAPAGPASIAGARDARSPALHRYDGVTARFLPPGASVPQNLPGGAEGFAQRARRVFRDPPLRIAGRARLPIIVR